MALLIVILVAAGSGLVGTMLGYYKGYDEGFEAALECYEEEVKEWKNTK